MMTIVATIVITNAMPATAWTRIDAGITEIATTTIGIIAIMIAIEIGIAAKQRAAAS